MAPEGARPQPGGRSMGRGEDGRVRRVRCRGPYDKGRLARLFGGSSPRAARGSLVTPPGRVAVALISPYPDLAITSLQQGTLVILTRLPRAR